MTIIFLCPTGTYASLVAANLYLGIIDKNSKVKDIIDLPNFGHNQGKPGFFLFIGQDLKGNKIYSLATDNEAQIIRKSARDLLKLFDCEVNNVHFWDVSGYMPKYTGLCSSLFPQQTKRFLARKLYGQINSIYREIKLWDEQEH